MALKRHALLEWVLSVPDVVWVKPRGFLWLGRWGRRPAVRARHLPCRAICSTVEVTVEGPESESEGKASSNLRRLLARKKAFNCAEADIGDMELFYKAQNRKGLPRWRGPAKVIGMDESGVTVTFQSQTFKVARYCVRRRPKDSDLQGGERPALAMLHDCGTARWETICG